MTPTCAAAAVVSAVVLRTAGIEVGPHYHQLLVEYSMKPQDPPEEGKRTMKMKQKNNQNTYEVLRKQTPHIFDPGFDVISSVRAWKRTYSKRDAGNVAATLLHVRHAESDVLLGGRSRQI